MPDSALTRQKFPNKLVLVLGAAPLLPQPRADLSTTNYQEYSTGIFMMLWLTHHPQ